MHGARSCLCWVAFCGFSAWDDARALDPPFAGTAFLSTDIISSSDWSTLTSISYTGQGSRWVFDRRVNQWVYQPMHLFDATFADGLDSEIQVNPEFGGQAAAAVEAETYGRAVGRLPTSMRVDVDSITIHKGFNPFGGGNNNILIHTDQAIQYGGYLEEVLFHEAAHTSYDAYHASSTGWLAAQQNDPTFISTYARDNPNREDIAESLLPWYALRYTDGLFPYQVEAINEAIPNRLAYFDALPFQLNEQPSSPGDFNGDGGVDAADLPYWRAGFGLSSGATAGDGDADGDEDADVSDILAWQRNQTPAASVVGVPEPHAVTLLILGAAIAFLWRPFLSGLRFAAQSA